MTFNKLALRICKMDSDDDINLDQQLPRASEILRYKPLRDAWDWLIIDEAQDITGRYIDFVEHLTNEVSYCIIAGDPRQEIYTGSRFFSDLWGKFKRDEKTNSNNNHSGENKFINNIRGCTLHYNHRSHPSIVKVLNIYSNFCFRTLHHDQISSKSKTEKNIKDSKDIKVDVKNNKDIKEIKTTKSKAVNILRCDRDQLSLTIAEELMKYKPNDVYIISPITVERFGLGTIFMSVKNYLAESSCIIPLQVLSDKNNNNSKYNTSDSVYNVGSARKLKGTERKIVILVGADISYTQYGIDDAEYKKALYVCLSRAIEKLVIIIPNDAKIDHTMPIASVINGLDSSSNSSSSNSSSSNNSSNSLIPLGEHKDGHGATPTKILKILTHMRVKDDISNNKASITCNDLTSSLATQWLMDPPTLVSGTLRIRFNEDFVGLYMEALLALKLGADVRSWEAIIKNPSKNIRVLNRMETIIAQSHGCFLETLPDKTYRLLLRSGESRVVPDDLLQCMEHCDESSSDNKFLGAFPKSSSDVKDKSSSDNKFLGAFPKSSSDIIKRAYVLSVLNYTSQIGKWWVASKDVLNAIEAAREEIERLIDALPDYLISSLDNESTTPSQKDTIKENIKSKDTSKGNKAIWGIPLNYNILCTRSSKTSSHIVGMADLLLKNTIIEMKFAQHKEAHIRQTAIYSAITGMPGVLINLLEGKTWYVKPANINEVGQFCRVALAIKNGRTRSMGRRIKCDVDLSGAVVVTLDVETDDGFPPNAPLMEVAGAACYFGTDDIEGTFSRCIESCVFRNEVHSNDVKSEAYPSGVNEVKSGKENKTSNITGLVRTKKDTHLEEENLRSKTRAWFNSLYGRKIGLVWGDCGDFQAAGIIGAYNSTDTKINKRDVKDNKSERSARDIKDDKLNIDLRDKKLDTDLRDNDKLNINLRDKKLDTDLNERCEKIKVINLRALYLSWLELNGCKRKSNTRLIDAVQHLFPNDFVWEPHRAFDDVVATIAVANAIIDLGHTL